MVMVVVVVAMIVVVKGLQSTSTSTEGIAQRTSIDIRPWGVRALSFDVVMMALLRQADFCLESNDLDPVLAHIAIHGVVSRENLFHPLGECLNNLWVVVEIAGLDKIDVRERFGDQVRKPIDSVDQNSSE